MKGNFKALLNIWNQNSTKKLIQQKGYHPLTIVSKTLQGSIIKAKFCKKKQPKAKHINDDNLKVIIKITKKKLHSESITILNNKKFKIKENIISETIILKHLNSQKVKPFNLLKFYDFFEDKNNFCLVIENGGMCLVDFVFKCHYYININLLSRKVWRLTVTKIFLQLIYFLDWLHNKMNVCHLDISLENIVISDVEVVCNKDKKIINIRNFKVRMIDYGLAEHFDIKENEYFKCNKYVGKTRYKSPEVYSKNGYFDARKADIWSLGISLIMMIIGLPVYDKPDINCDKLFYWIMNEEFTKVLKYHKKIKFMTPIILDLLKKIFKYEENRINLVEIMNHSWLTSFQEYYSQNNNDKHYVPYAIY